MFWRRKKIGGIDPLFLIGYLILELISVLFHSREHESELDSRAYEAVKGSLSTKIEAVVKTLIRIQVKNRIRYLFKSFAALN